ncbi:MAG: electron transfer flavoprotein subunit alpha/FixB family protein [Bacteroidia bacterium]|nr:electron transfer flavoprotein subunit alpha/FixB family protein [Bacteroidia bacterium]
MVLVYTESWEGKFKKATFEAVSYAAEVAKKLGTGVVAVSIGNVSPDDLAALGKYGATKVLSAKGDTTLQPGSWAAIIAGAAQKENAKLVILSHTYTGKSVAPRLAVRLKAGLAAGAVQLPSSLSPLTVRKKCFSNKGFTDVTVSTPVALIAITPNSYQVNTGSGTAAVEEFNPPDSSTGGSLTCKETKKATGKVALTEAEIVVSGGRGMKDPANWGMLEEMAGILGAATACSKPVADIGWRPHHEHVGQTGITIGANLYIAVGISGAIQHLAGVSSSKVMVVINSDKEAPFFKAADYGIVGDAFEVVPRLNAALKKLKSSS